MLGSWWYLTVWSGVTIHNVWDLIRWLSTSSDPSKPHVCVSSLHLQTHVSVVGERVVRRAEGELSGLLLTLCVWWIVLTCRVWRLKWKPVRAESQSEISLRVRAKSICSGMGDLIDSLISLWNWSAGFISCGTVRILVYVLRHVASVQVNLLEIKRFRWCHALRHRGSSAPLTHSAAGLLTVLVLR